MEEKSKKLHQLIEKYPRLFHGRPPRIHSQVPPGWEGLVDDLCRDVDAVLSDEEADGFCVLQIKEKLGALRFYVDMQGRSNRAGGFVSVHGARALTSGAPSPIDDLLDAAAQRSTVTCVKCGDPGKQVLIGGWIAVLCSAHAIARAGELERE